MDQVQLAERQDAGTAPSGDLRQRLAQAAETGTPGERALAHYLLANLPSLPFETAATVAAKVGVSEASVGRFCRSIG
ncbi:MAG: MurR/RpiR family transcriptional regulator, partial [Rhodocyclaceae bacterium]